MPKLKHIFRIVQSRKLFPKAEYKVLHKRTLKHHSSAVYSSVPEDLSYIPLSKSRVKSFNSSDTVFIVDHFHDPESFNETETSLILLNSSEEGVPVMVFSVKNLEGDFHFYLSYSANTKNIGEPVRDDFYLFTSEQGHPYMFYINGYFDRGESGSKTRTYLEQAYYIEYLGQQEIKAELKNRGINKVNIRLSEATVIDQRKLFY